MSKAKLVKQKGLIAAMLSLTDAVQREPGRVVKIVVAPESATNTVDLAVTAADGYESVDRFEVAKGLRRMCIYCAGFEATAALMATLQIDPDTAAHSFLGYSADIRSGSRIPRTEFMFAAGAWTSANASRAGSCATRTACADHRA